MWKQLHNWGLKVFADQQFVRSKKLKIRMIFRLVVSAYRCRQLLWKSIERWRTRLCFRHLEVADLLTGVQTTSENTSLPHQSPCPKKKTLTWTSFCCNIKTVSALALQHFYLQLAQTLMLVERNQIVRHCIAHNLFEIIWWWKQGQAQERPHRITPLTNMWLERFTAAIYFS